ncbi:MAG: hypothetical protein Tsb009_26210 [Planctomycetaceae bacterium]
MPRLFRSVLLISLVLAVPILPLLILGLSFEEQVADWLSVERSPGIHFFLIIAVLASDVFLPVPSSAVSTYAGTSGMGIWLATAASWLGMTLGGLIAFSLARIFGDRFVERHAGHDDLQRMAALTQRYGPAAIVVTRALPILAEACVLLMGATRLSWRRFLPPLMIANFVISITYAVFGVFFAESDAQPVAIAASALVPLAIALVARKWLPTMPDSDEDSVLKK